MSKSSTEHHDHLQLQEGYADLAAHLHHRPTSELPDPVPHPPPPSWLVAWEAKRPRWLIEMAAEAMGTFAYTLIGMGCQAAFVLTSAAKVTGEGDLLTIGLGYGIAIVFGILIAIPVSGGHLSPGYTITFAAVGAFPWSKVPRYIIAQIAGSFVATLLIYAQYKQQFSTYAAELAALGPAGEVLMFSPSGPAGVLAVFPTPGQNLGNVFLNEFIACSFLSVVVFTVLDPSNFMMSHTLGPIIIGIGYSACIWAFAVDTIALNTARDLGGRFACAAIYGTKCFPSKYSALAALTNIPATLFGAAMHLLILRDPSRPVVNHPPEGSQPVMEYRRKQRRDTDLARADTEKAASTVTKDEK